jgi:hypothetical protein
MRPQVMNTTLFIVKLIEVLSMHDQSAKPSYISLLVCVDFLPDPQASFNHDALFSCSQYPYFQSFGRLNFFDHIFMFPTSFAVIVKRFMLPLRFSFLFNINISFKLLLQ